MITNMCSFKQSGLKIHKQINILHKRPDIQLFHFFNIKYSSLYTTGYNRFS